MKSEMNGSALLHELLESSARHSPDSVALVTSRARLTYSMLNQQANHFASWMRAKGVSAGDRVVLILPNGVPSIVSFYGALKAGGVAVPLSADLKPMALPELLEQIRPSLIVTTERKRPALQHILRMSCPVGLTDLVVVGLPPMPAHSWPMCTSFEAGVEFGTGDDLGLSLSPHSLASLLFTSGSTGRPKGVKLTHGSLVHNTHAIVDSLAITAADVQMVVLPLHYVMGLSLLNTHIACGARVVLNNSFAFPASVLEQMVEEGVTAFSGVPATYAHLLHRSPLVRYRERLTSLRYCSQAGGHMPSSLKRALVRALPEHTRLYVMYGATEASARLTCLPADDLAQHMESIGKPVAGVELVVLDERGRVQSPGSEGELVASGPSIMRGYWRDPEATHAVMGEHGYRTGDLGYVDEQGFYYLTGRRDGLVKVSGHRVHTADVEEALYATETVAECVVVALPDALKGKRLAAMVVPIAPGTHENELRQLLSERLSRHQIPDLIRMVRQLPVTETGKTDRKRVQDQLMLESGQPIVTLDPSFERVHSTRPVGNKGLTTHESTHELRDAHNTQREGDSMVT